MSNTRPKKRPGKTDDMHAEDIKAEIRKRGKSLTELSLDHGYAAAAVGLALKQRWPSVERIIAEFIGKQPHEIWPSRYDQKTKKSLVRTWRRRAA